MTEGRNPVYPRVWVVVAFGQASLKCLAFVFQSLLTRMSRLWKEQRGSAGEHGCADRLQLQHSCLNVNLEGGKELAFLS